MRYIIGQLNNSYILKPIIVTSCVAQLVESLALNSDVAGSRPVVVIIFFFTQIIFLKSILPTIGVHFGSFFLI